MRSLAVFGLLLVAAMQLIFLATGGDRPAPYREIQALSIAATATIAWGAWRGHHLAMAAGSALDLLARLLQPLLGLTRLPLWANALLALGWALACLQSARRRDPAAGLWILGAAHFLAATISLSRLTAAAALTIGAAGCFLAAANVGRGAGG